MNHQRIKTVLSILSSCATVLAAVAGILYYSGSTKVSVVPFAFVAVLAALSGIGHVWMMRREEEEVTGKLSQFKDHTVDIGVLRFSRTNNDNRPPYRAKFTWGVEGSVLWLRDQGQDCRSLTNDIENSLTEIAHDLPLHMKLTNYRIIYQDSEGTWDAVAITSMPNLKVRFISLGKDSYEKAAQTIMTDKKYEHSASSSTPDYSLN